MDKCYKCYKSKANYEGHYFKTKIHSDSLLTKLSSDIYGPFSTEDFDTDLTAEKVYILTITDVFSRFTQIYLLEKIGAKDLINCFEKWVRLYKPPSVVITDNGRQYVGAPLKEYFKEMGIKHILIPEYSPQSNGISERINRSIT